MAASLDPTDVQLWRACVECGGDRPSLERYVAFLDGHDPARASYLHKRLALPVIKHDLHREQAAWKAAIAGVGACQALDFTPCRVPSAIELDAKTFIAHADALFTQLPFLAAFIDFPRDRASIDAVFACPALARVEKLRFRAHVDEWDPDESYELMRLYFADDVLAAMATSPHVAQLESLYVPADSSVSDVVARLAPAPFSKLRELLLFDTYLSNDQVERFVALPWLSTVTRLSVGVRTLRGALEFAASPHLRALADVWIGYFTNDKDELVALRDAPWPAPLARLKVGPHQLR